MMPLLFSRTLLFYASIAFAYFAVFLLFLSFFAHTAQHVVLIAIDLSNYLDFVMALFMALFMAFVVSFKVQVAIVLLCWSGMVTPEDLRKKRVYVLVSSFVIGIRLTPLDVFSQTLLAYPCKCCLKSACSSPDYMPCRERTQSL